MMRDDDRAKALDIRQAEERARKILYQRRRQESVREAVKIAKYACECHNTPQGPDPENCDGCGLQARAREMGLVEEAESE
jgi:hypothetical protein